MAVAAQLATLRKGNSAVVRSGENTDAAEAALAQISARCSAGWASGRLAVLSADDSARLAGCIAAALPDSPAALVLTFLAKHYPAKHSAILLAALPLHETPLFARSVRTLGNALAGTPWAFLVGLQPAGINRAALVQRAARDHGQLAALLLDHVRSSLAQQLLVPAFVRFYAAFFAELIAHLSAAQLRETYAALLMPYALLAVRAAPHIDLQLAGAMHFALLHARTPLPAETLSSFVAEFLRTASATPQAREAAMLTLVLLDAPLPNEALTFFASWPRAALALERPAAAPLLIRLAMLALNAALASPPNPQALPFLISLISRPALRTAPLLSAVLSRLHALHRTALGRTPLLVPVARELLTALPASSLTNAVQRFVHDLSPSASQRPALLAFLSAVAPPSAAGLALPLFLSLHHADAAVRALAWAQLNEALGEESAVNEQVKREAGGWLNSALGDDDDRVLIAALSAVRAAPLASPEALQGLLTSPRINALLLSSPGFATALLERFLPARPSLPPLSVLLSPLLPLLFHSTPHATAARRLLAGCVPALDDAQRLKRRANDKQQHAGSSSETLRSLEVLAASLSAEDIAALERRPSSAALVLLSVMPSPALAAIERIASVLIGSARKAKHVPHGLDAAIEAVRAASVGSPSRKLYRTAAAAAVAHACSIATSHVPFHAPLIRLAIAARPSPLTRALLRSLVQHSSVAQLAALAVPPDPTPALSLLSALVATHSKASLDALLPPLLVSLTSPKPTERKAALRLAAQVAQHSSGALQGLAKAVVQEATEVRTDSHATLEQRAVQWLISIDESALSRFLPLLLSSTHASQQRTLRLIGSLLAAKPTALSAVLQAAAADEATLSALLQHVAPLWTQPQPATALLAALKGLKSAALLVSALSPSVLSSVAPSVAAPLFDLLVHSLHSASPAERPAFRLLLSALPLTANAWAERLASPDAALLVERLPDALIAHPALISSAPILSAALVTLFPRLAPPCSPFAAQAALTALTRLLELVTDKKERARLSTALENAAFVAPLLALLDAWPAEPALQTHAAHFVEQVAHLNKLLSFAALLEGLASRLDSLTALKLVLAALLPRVTPAVASAALHKLLARFPEQRAALLASAYKALPESSSGVPLMVLVTDPLVPPTSLGTDTDEAHIVSTGTALIARLPPAIALTALLTALEQAKGAPRIRLLRTIGTAVTTLEQANHDAIAAMFLTLICSPDAPRSPLAKVESTALSDALQQLEPIQKGAPLLSALREVLLPASATTLSPAARRRALHLLNERCVALASTDDPAPALSLLPALTAVLHDKNAPSAALQTALQSIEVLVRVLGSHSPQPFEALLPALTALLRNPQPPSAAAAALALGSYAAALGVRLLSHLPVLFPALLAALTAPDAELGGVSHLALLSATQVLIGHLSAFVGPYLSPLLALLSAESLRSSAALSEPLAERLAELERQLISCTAPRVLLPALFASCTPSLALPSRVYLLQLVQRVFEDIPKDELVAQHKLALKFFLRILSPPLADAAGAALLSLVLRLNEAQFKPLFLQLLEWAALLSPERAALDERIGVMYHLAALFASRLQALFVPYTGYLLDDALARLQASSDRSTRLPASVWSDVLSLLSDALKHDASSFFDKPRFDLLTAVLVPQLDLASHSTYDVEAHVVPVLSELGVAMASDALWKGLNSAVLLKTRSKHASVRIAALAVLDALFGRLGEEYLILVPECIPYLSELLEDSNAEVEARCQCLITTIDGLMGGTGSVREFFQR